MPVSASDRLCEIRLCLMLVAATAGLFACGSGGGSGGAGGGAIDVSLTPRATSLTPSQTQRFTATVTGDANTAVDWSVDGVAGGDAAVGTLSATGLYTPGSAAGAHSVTATSQADGTTSATATVGVTHLSGVLTFHNDIARTGQNSEEYALTPASVTPTAFGKRFSCAVDGQIYAQPLYVASLSIAGGVHNVIFVATEHDSVYAFDADASPCVQYWKKNYLGPGITPVDPDDTGERGDLRPEIGITGTPVIDLPAHTLFLVARTNESGAYVQRLHALDLATGAEKFGGPIQIQAQVPGVGTGTDGTDLTFDSLFENQRAALLLSNGIVYITWGSHGDHGNYHGWVIGYDATTLAQVRVFTPSANGDGAGIWMSGDGPAVDSDGNLYVISGNGEFSATGAIPLVAPDDALGDSIIKVSTAGALSVTDYFTPQSQAILRDLDFDLGSCGVVVIPDGLGPPGHPDLVIGGGKEGFVYVLDRDDLGKYTAGGPDQVVQRLDLPGFCIECGVFGAPAVWRNGPTTAVLYVGAVDATLRAYSLVDGEFSEPPTSETAAVYGFPATSPAVSSNGMTDAIVWTLETSTNGSGLPPGNTLGPAILRAYDATDLAHVLFESDATSANTCGDAVKFTVPTVANGKVYVGGYDQVTVYALLP